MQQGSNSQPVDVVLSFYLLVTGLLALTITNGAPIFFGHIIAILAIRYLRSKSCPLPDLIKQFYCIPLTFGLYMEIDFLSEWTRGKLYDELVLSWERFLFGDPTPASWLSERFNYFWLSEYLHFCYFGFYFLSTLLAWDLYRSGRKKELQNYFFLNSAGSLGCYFIAIWFPVAGPRPTFPPLDPSLQGPFWRLCHYLCGQGAAAGAAFPSGHCCVAMTALIAAFLWSRRALIWVAPLSLGILLATVYGRFHYVVDLLAGAGFALFLASWWVNRSRRE